MDRNAPQVNNSNSSKKTVCVLPDNKSEISSILSRSRKIPKNIIPDRHILTRHGSKRPTRSNSLPTAKMSLTMNHRRKRHRISAKQHHSGNHCSNTQMKKRTQKENPSKQQSCSSPNLNQKEPRAEHVDQVTMTGQSSNHKRKSTCKQLRSTRRVSRVKKKDKSLKIQEVTNTVTVTGHSVTGFNRGLEAEKIIGIYRRNGPNSQFLMKWKGNNDLELVDVRDANQWCPQVVIRYYEAHLFFHLQEVKVKEARNYHPEMKTTST